MTKTLAALATAAALSLAVVQPTQAAWRGHHGHGWHGGGAFVGGFVAGAVIGGVLSAPRYYQPYYGGYGPAYNYYGGPYYAPPTYYYGAPYGDFQSQGSN